MVTLTTAITIYNTPFHTKVNTRDRYKHHRSKKYHQSPAKRIQNTNATHNTQTSATRTTPATTHDAPRTQNSTHITAQNQLKIPFFSHIPSHFRCLSTPPPRNLIQPPSHITTIYYAFIFFLAKTIAFPLPVYSTTTPSHPTTVFLLLTTISITHSSCLSHKPSHSYRLSIPSMHQHPLVRVLLFSMIKHHISAAFPLHHHAIFIQPPFSCLRARKARNVREGMHQIMMACELGLAT